MYVATPFLSLSADDLRAQLDGGALSPRAWPEWAAS